MGGILDFSGSSNRVGKESPEAIFLDRFLLAARALSAKVISRTGVLGSGAFWLGS